MATGSPSGFCERRERGEGSLVARSYGIYRVARFVSYGIRRSVSVHLANTFGYGG